MYNTVYRFNVVRVVRMYLVLETACFNRDTLCRCELVIVQLERSCIFPLCWMVNVGILTKVEEKSNVGMYAKYLSFA